MLPALQNSGAIIVIPIPAPSHDATFGDVVMAAVGLTGVLVIVSLVAGVLLAGVLVFWNRRHRPEEDRMPSVSPLVPEPSPRESSQAR